MMYGVRVMFYNIDTEEIWERDYIIDKEPDNKWLQSLYDGTNRAEEYKILMKTEQKEKERNTMEQNGTFISDNLYERWKKNRSEQGIDATAKDNFVEWIAEQIELLW